MQKILIVALLAFAPLSYSGDGDTGGTGDKLFAAVVHGDANVRDAFVNVLQEAASAFAGEKVAVFYITEGEAHTLYYTKKYDEIFKFHQVHGQRLFWTVGPHFFNAGRESCAWQ